MHQVQCPAGLGPGDTWQAVAPSGQPIQVKVPSEVRAGQMFQVQVEQVLEVKCPQDAVPGSTIHVHIKPGNDVLTVQCPPDLRPGDTMRVVIPDTGQSMDVSIPPGVLPGQPFAVMRGQMVTEEERRMERRISELEAQKMDAVAKEDYDAAKQIKLEVDKLRASIAAARLESASPKAATMPGGYGTSPSSAADAGVQSPKVCRAAQPVPAGSPGLPPVADLLALDGADYALMEPASIAQAADASEQSPAVNMHGLDNELFIAQAAPVLEVQTAAPASNETTATPAAAPAFTESQVASACLDLSALYEASEPLAEVAPALPEDEAGATVAGSIVDVDVFALTPEAVPGASEPKESFQKLQESLLTGFSDSFKP